MTKENGVPYCYACKKNADKLQILVQFPNGDTYHICEDCDKNRNKAELLQKITKTRWLEGPNNRPNTPPEEPATAEPAAADIDKGIEELKTEIE